MTTAQDKAIAHAKRRNESDRNQEKGATQGFLALLEHPQMKKQISDACTQYLRPERLIRIARTAVQRNPALWNCSPISFIAAIMDAAQLGLEPIPNLGHVYLVPYKNNKSNQMEVQMQLGYKGILALAHRTEKFKVFDAQVIHEGEQFEMCKGTEPMLRHVPGMYRADDDHPPIIGAWAAAYPKDGGCVFEVIDMAIVEDARNRSQSYKMHKSGPWVDHYRAMVRKTAIRRLAPLLPMAVEVQSAVAADEARDYGTAGVSESLLQVQQVPELMEGGDATSSD